MKKILLVFVILFPWHLLAQTEIDLGIKGGINYSKVSIYAEDYTAQSITKSHIGIFGRIGWNRVFLQPELYCSGKGGDVTTDIAGTLASFDFSTFDIPVLLGYRIIQGENINIHILAGPVLSNITKSDLTGGEIYNESFYRNRYLALQYGFGVDVLFLNFSARIENGLENFYDQPDSNAKNNSFMLSVGFKFL